MFQTYGLHSQKLYAMVYILSLVGIGEYRADYCKFVMDVIYEDAGIGFGSDRLFEKNDRRREHGKLV